MLDSLPVKCFRPLRVKNPRFRGDSRSFRVRFNALMYPEDYKENYYIDVPCGKCYLCRKRRANGWRIRLFEELKTCERFEFCGKSVYRCIFVCFTFDDAHLPVPESRANVAGCIRKWRDLWRKAYGRSPRYFCTTDKGSQFGRLHLHLLIFNPYDYKKNRALDIEDLECHSFYWRNGMVREPSWLEGESGITYVSGYITGSGLEKDAMKHGKPICKEALEYVPFIFVSNGLGASALAKYQESINTLMKVKCLDADGEHFIRGKGFKRDVYSYCENKSFVYDPKTLNVLYRVGGYDYGLPSYYRYKLVPYYFRWHSNLIYKREVEDYKSRNENLRYMLSGFEYSYESLKILYDSAYRKFDKDENQCIKLL